MTNGKQRIRDILKRLFKDGTIDDVAGNAEKWEQISVDQALDSIEEVVKEVIGQENEHYKDMPVPDPDPFALPSDHQNQLRRYQLGRWESK